ncbi:MAG: ATP-binding protein [Arcobacteraceae bacterium]
MGEAIYGSKDLGLRELLQNSIDAIMVKKDMFEIKNLSQKNTYTSIIEINIDEENNKFIIKDNGMGMNEYIIKNYFLNVGKSYYKSKDFLNYKHNYNPIGNFGIGFLSCFMLSNEVQVITKHFDSNKKYIIDLEKNSEYIAFKEETDNGFESGSEIILDLKDIKKVFNADYELELQIKTFLEENILIKDFLIKLNNKSLENKTKSLTENNNIHKIDISKYLSHIEGEIQITQEKYNNNILDELVDIEYLVYFDGKEFIEIKNYNDLDVKNILRGFELEYIKIPLIQAGYENDFDLLNDSGHIDNSDALNIIYNKQKNKKNIYFFINKNTSIFDSTNYGDYYGNDDWIFYNDEDGDSFYIENILKNLEIKHFISLGAIYVKKHILHNENHIFPFKDKKYPISFGNTFIKNIKINHKYDNFKYCDLIGIKIINLTFAR